MDALWKSTVLTLIEVEGPRLIRGNRRFGQLYGKAEQGSATSWASLLGFSDVSGPINWLTSPDSLNRAYVGRTILKGEGSPQWLRLRRFGGESAPESDVALIEVEDVTEERDAFERVRLEGQHFHALIERSSEGISLFDLEANIIYESPSNKRIHGYESWEMEGKNLFDFCHEDDLARALPRFENLAKAPGIVETEIVRFKHKDGHWIYLEGTVINATDDPRVGALVNNFRDVTARLDAERELRRAKESAEGAQRLQQHFLTNLSHEFKTPLTLIRGPLLDLAEGRIDPVSIPDVMSRVLRNVDRLNSLITELVDLSRLDAGTFGLQVNQHDLVEFIRAELDAFSEAAKARLIDFKLEGPPRCSVFFDLPKLERVVSNLLSNALRYAPDGSRIEVSLRLEASEEDGAVRVSVRDFGQGMDAATRTRVFDRFYQADTALNRDHGGMGIGLALAREMVEMHGGRIGVDSEPGEGTCFWFTLPLGCAHFDPDDIDTGAVREPRPHTVGGSVATAQPVGLVEKAAHRPRLLLIEDNEDMRAYLRMNLDPYYTVTEAEDGRGVLEVMERSKPEIVVSDVMMPHVDGLAVCRQLKASARWKSVPFLLLSAKGSVDHRVEGLKTGADDYIPKPFSVAELLQRLRARVPWGVDVDEKETGWCEKLEACIADNLTSPEFDVKGLAEALGYSERQLLRRVMQHAGLKPSALILQRRLERAHELIQAKRYDTLAEVAHAVCLSPGYFSRRYRRTYGETGF
jgi:PAS domain S-box-containing protein